MTIAVRLQIDEEEIGEWPVEKFARWVAYFNSEWDPKRDDDRRAGTIAAVVANVMTVRGEYEVSDFMPTPAYTRDMGRDEAEVAVEKWAKKNGVKILEASE